MQSTKTYILDMVSRFRTVLDAHNSHLKCFYNSESQVEGWLKGELIFFLDGEKTSERLANFEKEAPCGFGRKKIDLCLQLTIAETPVWIELKHWHIGKQKGETWNAHNYFGDKTIGIQPDVEKLSSIPKGDKYVLILNTRNPGDSDWTKGVDKFNNKFIPLRIKSLTLPNDFPESYFLGLLEVVKC